LPEEKQLNHHTQVTGHILEDKSSSLLRDFFIEKRKIKQENNL
jgi:hypothetical protein